MDEALTRKEVIEAQDKKIKLLHTRMRDSLSEMSRTKGGINVLRYLLHESGFLASLTFVTATGVNKDVLLSNEAKRQMYLGIRQYMDIETIKRVEFEEQTKGGSNE